MDRDKRLSDHSERSRVGIAGGCPQSDESENRDDSNRNERAFHDTRGDEAEAQHGEAPPEHRIERERRSDAGSDQQELEDGAPRHPVQINSSPLAVRAGGPQERTQPLCPRSPSILACQSMDIVKVGISKGSAKVPTATQTLGVPLRGGRGEVPCACGRPRALNESRSERSRFLGSSRNAGGTGSEGLDFIS